MTSRKGLDARYWSCREELGRLPLTSDLLDQPCLEGFCQLERADFALKLLAILLGVCAVVALLSQEKGNVPGRDCRLELFLFRKVGVWVSSELIGFGQWQARWSCITMTPTA